MRAALAQLPAGLPEARAHCIASALIARRCSAIEAQLAGTGKELRDLFTRGDASWDDWRADRAGIACDQARSARAPCSPNSLAVRYMGLGPPLMAHDVP